MIVTAALLRRQLNLDDVPGDTPFLEHKIEAAEAFIAAYIGKALAEIDPMPASIKEAVLMLAAHLYVNREASLVGVSANELPFGVLDLIRPHREWTL